MTQINMINVEVALVAAANTILVPAGEARSYVRIWNKSASSEVIYITDDGSTPSANNGFPLVAGAGYEYPSNTQVPTKEIRCVSSGTPRVNVCYA